MTILACAGMACAGLPAALAEEDGASGECQPAVGRGAKGKSAGRGGAERAGPDVRVEGREVSPDMDRTFEMYRDMDRVFDRVRSRKARSGRKVRKEDGRREERRARAGDEERARPGRTRPEEKQLDGLIRADVGRATGFSSASGPSDLADEQFSSSIGKSGDEAHAFVRRAAQWGVPFLPADLAKKLGYTP